MHGEHSSTVSVIVNALPHLMSQQYQESVCVYEHELLAFYKCTPGLVIFWPV